MENRTILDILKKLTLKRCVLLLFLLIVCVISFLQAITMVFLADTVNFEGSVEYYELKMIFYLMVCFFTLVLNFLLLKIWLK